MEMIHMVAGGEAAWRARPFVSLSNCFVVPPMKFATESCITMEACIRAGMPVLLLSAGQAGATRPRPSRRPSCRRWPNAWRASSMSTPWRPGHPAVFGTWPFVSDLRTGAMSGGSASRRCCRRAAPRCTKFYGIPGGAAGGMSDSKLPDMQAGWEQGIINALAGCRG
jgi:trimethylamine--corrinoid protein Co-methyltransferase